MKLGYKVVFQPAEPGQPARSMGGPGPLGRAVRVYQPGKPVEPAPGAGPLHVARSLQDALDLAYLQTLVQPDMPGQLEVWEVEWQPWAGKLPRDPSSRGKFGQPAALAGWNGEAACHATKAQGMPPGTRLARRVVLRRKLARVYVLRRPDWAEIKCEKIAP